MSGRSRKSKNFTLPGNPGSVPPPLPMSPAQAGRLGELWLIHCFTGTLLLHWRSRLDALGTMRMVVAVGGPAISKKEAAEMFEEEEEEEEDAHLPSIAMLWAATRWVLALDLPGSQSELRSRPPIWQRVRIDADQVASVKTQVADRDAPSAISGERPVASAPTT